MLMIVPIDLHLAQPMNSLEISGQINVMVDVPAGEDPWRYALRAIEHVKLNSIADILNPQARANFTWATGKR